MSTKTVSSPMYTWCRTCDIWSVAGKELCGHFGMIPPHDHSLCFDPDSLVGKKATIGPFVSKAQEQERILRKLAKDIVGHLVTVILGDLVKKAVAPYVEALDHGYDSPGILAPYDTTGTLKIYAGTPGDTSVCLAEFPNVSFTPANAAGPNDVVEPLFSNKRLGTPTDIVCQHNFSSPHQDYRDALELCWWAQGRKAVMRRFNKPGYATGEVVKIPFTPSPKFVCEDTHTTYGTPAWLSAIEVIERARAVGARTKDFNFSAMANTDPKDIQACCLKYQRPDWPIGESYG